jgi:hypothetical protein
MDLIDDISPKLLIIVGIIIFIFGLIGNILNIYVFPLWSYPRRAFNSNNVNRTSNSPLYLLISSILNLMIIIYPLVTRILFDGFQYRIPQDNVFILRKFQYYTLHTFDIISLTCICMAIFDRYLTSSRNVRLRQMSSTRQQTYLIILFIICLNAFHVSNTNECIVDSRIYLYYYLFVFQIFFHGIIPVSFLTIFGILTIKQLKLIGGVNHRLKIDKQMSRMLLLMSIGIILSSIPYSIEQFYYVIISHNNESQSPLIFLLHIISSILFYTNPGYCFVIFYISTPNFRLQVQKLLVCKKLIRHPFHNQVNPVTNSRNLH